MMFKQSKEVQLRNQISKNQFLQCINVLMSLIGMYIIFDTKKLEAGAWFLGCIILLNIIIIVDNRSSLKEIDNNKN